MNCIDCNLKDKVTIEKDFSSLPKLICYPDRLNQVILNILHNAVEGIEKNGVIHLKTFFDGSNICIECRDNGTGIPKAILPKIFEPFFTTKDTSKKAGLGLNIVDKIIKMHNGKIIIESEVGKGTKVTISLPSSVPKNQREFQSHFDSPDLVTRIEMN